MRARFDLEADGLLEEATRVHVLRVRIKGCNPVHTFLEHQIEEGLALLDKCETIVAHNGLAFDCMVLWKLFKWKPKAKIVDTFLIAQLLSPDNQGYNSLEWWGHELGLEKIDYKAAYIEWRTNAEHQYKYQQGDEWKECNPVMVEYCGRDVEVLERLDDYLLKEQARIEQECDTTLQPAIDMEHRFAKDFALQAWRGVYVDQPHTHSLLKHIDDEMERIKQIVEPLLPEKPANKGELADLTPKGKFKKNGQPDANMEKWWDSIWQDAGLRNGRWFGIKNGKTYKLPHPDPIAYKVPAKLSDQEHIKNWLQQMGWKPTAWNFKKDSKTGKYVRGDDGQLIPTQPKLHDKGELCPNLERINSEFEHVNLVVKWVVYRHRRGLVQGVINLTRKDGTISAGGWSLGTPTSRVTHSGVANIPKAEEAVMLGKECRAMFRARPGRKLVGVDAAGLELCMLAHYVGSPELIDMVTSGDKEKGTDIHSVLWKACDPLVPSRSIQKNCVPMDTQALTPTGWKYRHQLKVGDAILTYNPKTGIKEWDQITHLTDNRQAVVRLSNKHGFDVRSTAGHRWYVRQRRRTKTGKLYTGENYMVDSVKTTDEINSESNIIVNAPMATYRQSSWAGYKGDKWGVDWVSRVLSMSSSERQAFLAGFMVADGYSNPNTGRMCWSQNRNELYEAALVATYLETSGFLHITATQQKNGEELMRCTVSGKSHITAQRFVKEQLEEQEVWCPTVENGAWIMRQGDVITITGNCTYGWLYGASDKKLGQTAGHPDGKAERAGKEIRSRMVASIPGLDKFMKKIEAISKRGYILAIDGRRIELRSKHATLNTLLQSAGSILVKTAQCYANARIRKLRLDGMQVISYHDEVQYDCHPLHAQEVGQLFIEGLVWAGRKWGCKCPLSGEVKVGVSWANTH